MQCSDLERYLEAYLDLRLGRSRGAILRRHLSACAACRTRVNHLRQFERDLQRQFRAMERVHSVWNGLEPDLVRSGGGLADAPSLPFLPPDPLPAIAPPSGHSAARALPAAAGHASGSGTSQPRRMLGLWSRRLAGALIVLVAIGAVGTSVTEALRPAPGNASLRAYYAYRDGPVRPPLTTGDAERLRAQFASRLGAAFPMPPTPAGFTLAGGWIDESASPPGAAIVYERDGRTTLLYVEPGPATPPAAPVEGVSQVHWSQAGYSYSLVSPLASPELAGFAVPMAAEAL